MSNEYGGKAPLSYNKFPASKERLYCHHVQTGMSMVDGLLTALFRERI